MNFAEAVEYLNEGKMISRKGWNGKDIFVFKQIEYTLPSEMFKDNLAMPQRVCEKIASMKVDITYSNQMYIVHPDGRINTWVPSSSDIFAEDWYEEM